MKTVITDADYDGKILGLIAHMKGTETFQDYNYEGSGMRALLRVLAMHASDSALYANLTFNERYIKTGEIRGNVAAAAIEQGYVPNSKVAPTAKVNVVVNVGESLTSPLTLGRNAKFMGVKDGTTYIFSPTEVYSAEEVDGVVRFEGVSLKQGQWVTKTSDIEGSGIQTIEIDSPDIDISTLSVNCWSSIQANDPVEYTRYRNAYDLGAEEKIFFVSLNREGNYEVEFGDGVLSFKPSGGFAELSYLETSGPDGNGITKFSPVSLVDGYADVTVELISGAANGSDVEDIDSIRQLAPLTFGSGGLAVTFKQYIPIVKELFPDADVACWGGENNVPKKQGYVMISVKPKTDEVLDEAQKDALVAHIDGRNVGSITPLLIDPDFIYLNLSFKNYWNPSRTTLTSTGVITRTKEAVASWAATNIEKFSKNFDSLSLSTFVKNYDTSFVTNVLELELEKRFSVSLGGQYTYSYGKALEPSSLLIEGVTFGSVEYQIYDDTGVLRLRSNGITVPQTSAGEIDYETGEVTVALPSGYQAEDAVSIVKPDGVDYNFDVLRNQILLLGDITVEPVTKKVV